MTNLENKILGAIKDETKLGGDWNKLLEAEAHRLYKLIHEEIARYYHSYTPKVYKRTGSFYDSLRINVSNDAFEIYFEPNLAYKKDVFVPTMLDQGWYFNDSRYHFSYYEGFTFIENAIHRFRQTTSLPIRIQIESKYYPEIYGSWNQMM